MQPGALRNAAPTRLGGAGGPARRHHADDVVMSDRVDDVQRRRHYQQIPQVGQRHEAEALPGVGAIECGGLVLLLRNRLQACMESSLL